MSDLLTPASGQPADDMAIAEARTRRRGDLLDKLAQAINFTSTENASNTPDFILANFAAACLDAFAEASVAREAWYGKSLSIDGETSDIAALEARTPAPATDVDALLAEADAMLSRMATRGDDKAFNVIQRLATALRESRAREQAGRVRAEKAEADLADLTQTTGELCPECHWRGVRDDGCEFCKAHRLEADLATALRESRAREVAEPYRHALEQRLIGSNLPLLTGDADADLMRFVFHEQELALSPEAGTIAELREVAKDHETAHKYLDGAGMPRVETDETSLEEGEVLSLAGRVSDLIQKYDAAIARAEKAEAEQHTAFQAGEAKGRAEAQADLAALKQSLEFEQHSHRKILDVILPNGSSNEDERRWHMERVRDLISKEADLDAARAELDKKKTNPPLSTLAYGTPMSSLRIRKPEQ